MGRPASYLADTRSVHIESCACAHYKIGRASARRLEVLRFLQRQNYVDGFPPPIRRHGAGVGSFVPRRRRACSRGTSEREPFDGFKALSNGQTRCPAKSRILGLQARLPIPSADGDHDRKGLVGITAPLGRLDINYPHVRLPAGQSGKVEGELAASTQSIA